MNKREITRRYKALRKRSFASNKECDLVEKEKRAFAQETCPFKTDDVIEANYNGGRRSGIVRYVDWNWRKDDDPLRCWYVAVSFYKARGKGVLQDRQNVYPKDNPTLVKLA